MTWTVVFFSDLPHAVGGGRRLPLVQPGVCVFGIEIEAGQTFLPMEVGEFQSLPSWSLAFDERGFVRPTAGEFLAAIGERRGVRAVRKGQNGNEGIAFHSIQMCLMELDLS